MCGLTGFLSVSTSTENGRLQELLSQMANAIEHRGPDSQGYWTDPAAGFGLAHRRLAIVDQSPAGAQPMVSASGRYVLAFNGEIYNHTLLRRLLERDALLAASWRGHSDTETLLAGVDFWGLEKTLQKAIGMFAIALWDRDSQTLTLARDRFGEKPMYYGWQGQGRVANFLFASELSAFRRHPAFLADIDRDSIAMFMRYSCVGGADSIYRGVKKLLPGHLLTVSRIAPEPAVRVWWSRQDAVLSAVKHPFKGTAEDAVNELEILLKDAIGQQMVADVPLGAFLSGGIDSSAVVALMQSQSHRPVRTFSVGFNEKSYNEAEYAKAVARHLGTDHTELYVSPQDAISVIPRLPTLYAEPFADSSQIPTFLVSQLAGTQVTVSLSGDAGDELFCGYRRYQMTAAYWGKLSRLPISLRQLVAYGILSVSPRVWDRLGVLLSRSQMGYMMHKGATLLNCHSATDLYQGLLSHWSEPASIVLGTTDLNQGYEEVSAALLTELSDVERMMVNDLFNYMPDDVLVKVDRAAMGVSLETRVPMLDHRVVEFAWSLPLAYKLREGVTKWPLRQVLYRYVPRGLIERPKMGFGVPIDHWLRGPLREWAEALLAEPRLRSEGFFDPAPIRRKWSEHLSGQRNWQYHLWDVLMFQAWLENQHG